MKLKWTVREKELSGFAFGMATANRRVGQRIKDQGQSYRFSMHLASETDMSFWYSGC
jgi:hypothetical protein